MSGRDEEWIATPDAGPPLSIEQAHPTLEVDEQALVRLLLCVLEGEEATLHDLTLVLADHETVLELNRSYLGHDYHTDVISFPLNEEPDAVEGEVYVDLDTAQERHAEFGASFEEEVQRYAVHGLLHLVGYTDATEGERAGMRALEQRYLRDCNNQGRAVGG